MALKSEDHFQSQGHKPPDIIPLFQRREGSREARYPIKSVTASNSIFLRPFCTYVLEYLTPNSIVVFKQHYSLMSL